MGAALSDRNIDSVSFTGDSFEIRYRSRGYLFSFIPMSFPVRVTVALEASSSRAIVRLPWYRFFVREFFTAKKLAEEVDAVVVREIESNLSTDVDIRVKVFDAVAKYLRGKVGTIADTVNAGAQQ
jgi:hypothetical protein